MSQIAADKLCDRGFILLVDKTGTRWPIDELVTWLNDGQRQIVQLRPDAYTVTEPVQLVAGTKQAIPAERLRLIDIIRNMGLNGSTPGRACRYVRRDVLDQQVPSWHTDTAEAEAQHWLYDPRNPKVFWVYPQQPAAAHLLEAVMSALPEDATIGGVNGANETSVLGLDDIYANALLEFMVYRAYSKDAKHTVQGGKADLAWRSFMTMLGLKSQVDSAFDPEDNTPPRRPKAAVGAFGRVA